VCVCVCVCVCVSPFIISKKLDRDHTVIASPPYFGLFVAFGERLTLGVLLHKVVEASLLTFQMLLYHVRLVYN